MFLKKFADALLNIKRESRAETKTDLYPAINKIVQFLKNEDYEINEESKSVLLTTKGMEFSEKLLKENGLIQQGTLQDLQNITLNHNIIQALRANYLFLKDRDYIIKD